MDMCIRSGSYLRPRLGALAAVAVAASAVVAAPAHAAPLKIMSLGDSITFGTASTHGNGYRGYLQDLLNGTTTSYDFVGTLNNGSGGYDLDHYGIPGIKAYDFGNVSKSLRDQLNINTVFPTLQGAGNTPDTILLHIQTNAFNGGGGGDPVGIELERLLRGLTITNPGSSHYIGLNSNPEIILARILPKAGNPASPNTDGGTYSGLTQHQARVKSSFDFNYGGASNPQWANGIDSVVASRSEFDGHIKLVDMFRIDVDTLNLQYLLDQFGTALGITTTAELRAIISPEDDTLNGNPADWVDWVLNYDEVNNTFGAGTDGVNTNLYAPGDTIHPGDLGYAIMAQVWFNDAGLNQLLGDIDGDGFVGLTDINFVLSNWNQNVTPGDEAMGDLTNDGFVGIGDLNIILSNWNAGTPPPPSAGIAIVPEPAGATLMLVLTGVMLRRVR